MISGKEIERQLRYIEEIIKELNLCLTAAEDGETAEVLEVIEKCERKS